MDKKELKVKQAKVAALEKEIAKLRLEMRSDIEKERIAAEKKLEADIKALNLVKEFELCLKFKGKVEIAATEDHGDARGDLILTLEGTPSCPELTAGQLKLLLNHMEIWVNGGNYTIQTKGKTEHSFCPEAYKIFFSREETRKLNKLLGY